MSVLASKPPEERTTELQSKLYQAAKRDPSRRFHALYDKLSSAVCLAESPGSRCGRTGGAAGIDQQTLEAHRGPGRAGVPGRDRAGAAREDLSPPAGAAGRHPQRTRDAPGPLGIPDRAGSRGPGGGQAACWSRSSRRTSRARASFGFRPGLGPHDALAAVAENARRGFRWVVDADYRAVLRHAGPPAADGGSAAAHQRRRTAPADLPLAESGLSGDGDHHDTDQGSPQGGGPLAPAGQRVSPCASTRRSSAQKSFVGRLVRYADDFVIQCGTRRARGSARWVGHASNWRLWGCGCIRRRRGS